MSPPFQKGQESTKPMLLPKRHIVLFVFLATLALMNRASAGLYGFTQINPYSYEEELLAIDVPPQHIENYREKMRNNLMMLIDYAKLQKPEFQIISHEGQELLNKSLWEYHLDGYNQARSQGINANDPSFLLNLKERNAFTEPAVGTTARRYLNSLNAIAINNTYCKDASYPQKLIDKHHIRLISIDQCATPQDLDAAIVNSVIDRRLLYGFTGLEYAFNDIEHQPVINETAKNIMTVNDASNILLLTDDSRFSSKYDFIKALRNTNYDILVIRPLFHHQEKYSPEEIASLQFKKNGTKRLLIAEMNISEAHTFDYYWNRNWRLGNPSWLNRASFVNEDSVITSYWDPTWQKIISDFFKSIIHSGFDGVFFTGLENHQYFEKQTPLE